MSAKTTVKKIKSRTASEVKRAIVRIVGRSAKEYKDRTRQQIISQRASGAIYEKGKGDSFTRSHRASARGQRPAVETGTLLNALEDERTSEFSAKVDIAHRINPINGEDAHDYAERLQNDLDRPILNDAGDLRVAQTKFTFDLRQATL